MRYALPIALFIALIALLAVGLGRDPRHLPSPLIGKPLPAFQLSDLADPEITLERDDFSGEANLLNVWASWCVGCRVEHPALLELAKSGRIRLIGLNYKDTATDARAWLTQHGDPYRRTIHDPDGRLGLDLGVYGVPETFAIDRDGIIRYKHVGPITEAATEQLLRSLDQGG